MTSPFGDPEIKQELSPFGDPLSKNVSKKGVVGGPEKLGEMPVFKNNQYSNDPKLEPFRGLAKETTSGQAFGASVGRGASKILRGLGIMEVEDETERMAFKALSEEYPKATFSGEIVGEAAPFAAVPIGAIPSTIGRVGAAFGLGALEGGLIKKGEGKQIGEQISSASIGGTIAGGIEAGIPIIGRIGGALFRKITGRAPRNNLITSVGNPTPELTEALESVGLNFSDLAEATQNIIAKAPRGTDPAQIARASGFEELGIPATTGDVTKKFAQQAKEERLIQSAAEPLGEKLRDVRLKQSKGITSKLDDIVERSGMPEDVGTNIKKALKNRKGLLREKKNALYKKAAESSSNIGEIPFPIDNILLSMPDKRTLKRLGRLKGTQVKAVEDLMVEFGIDTSKEGIERAEKAGIDIQQLNLNNFEDFRSGLNQIASADQTGATSVMVGSIKDALDNEADNIGELFKAAGAKDDVLDVLKEARGTVRKLKTEFSPDAIAGKIINSKKDGFTEVMEASQVYKNIVGINKPKEYLERTVKSLMKSGKDGHQAMGSLQAATVMDLIDSGFKAQSRTIENQPVFGLIPFVKKFNAIGEERLKIIFRGNEAAYKKLKRIKDVSSSLIPDSGAVPKGSAAVNLDALISVIRQIPGSNIMFNTMATIADPIIKRGRVAKSLKAKPEVKRLSQDSIDILAQEFPSIAASFGIASVNTGDNK